MKILGYFLLCAGFLLAAYATALDTRLTNWNVFTPAALAAIVGVIILKQQAKGHARSETVLTANRTELNESLGNIVTQIGEMTAAGGEISTGELRNEIDGRLRDDLRRFADARESLVHLFGLQAYADIMSDFAAGERYINRVWSCSADGYDTEARTYLAKAARQFGNARQQLKAAAPAAGVAP